jgi:hypothetical protein
MCGWVGGCKIEKERRRVGKKERRRKGEKEKRILAQKLLIKCW